MKAGLLVVNYLKHYSEVETKKRRKKYPPHGKYEEMIDVPYIDDGLYHHKFDVYHGSGKKKNCCIIDIHGGAYIFGYHMDQYALADKFLENGYDWVSVDYRINNGKLSPMDQVKDIVDNLTYIFDHLKELGLENDCFAISGDSAGGHFALLITEMLLDKKYAKEVGFKMPDITPIAVLVNCPVYNFSHMGEGALTNLAMKRMFGPSYKDKEMFKLICPQTHRDSLTCPTFVSTCKKDFIRLYSVLMIEDMKEKDILFEYIDIDSDDKRVTHVHNVIDVNHIESIKVNEAMMNFLEKCLK